MTSPAATLSGVTKSYGRLRAVDGIDLEIPSGTLGIAGERAGVDIPRARRRPALICGTASSMF